MYIFPAHRVPQTTSCKDAGCIPTAPHNLTFDPGCSLALKEIPRTWLQLPKTSLCWNSNLLSHLKASPHVTLSTPVSSLENERTKDWDGNAKVARLQKPRSPITVEHLPRHEENNACNIATPAGPADREHPNDKGLGQVNALGIVFPLLSMHTDETDLTAVGRKPPLISV